MKRSNLMVSMPMTTFDELETYRNQLFELKTKIKECLEPSITNGIDYILDINNVLEIFKKECNITDSVNIEIFYDKKIGGKKPPISKT